MLNSSSYSGNRGLLVMCGLGRHRTGTVIACFRKLQRWNLTSILEEYRRYSGDKFRSDVGRHHCQPHTARSLRIDCTSLTPSVVKELKGAPGEFCETYT